MYVERTIRRIGNSLGLILPADILKILDIQERDEVRIYVKDNIIHIEPIKK